MSSTRSRNTERAFSRSRSRAFLSPSCPPTPGRCSAFHLPYVAATTTEARSENCCEFFPSMARPWAALTGSTLRFSTAVKKPSAKMRAVLASTGARFVMTTPGREADKSRPFTESTCAAECHPARPRSQELRKMMAGGFSRSAGTCR
jgi:hypothetical protein